MGRCSSSDEHIRLAIRDPFPLAADAQLPVDLMGAARFMRDMPTDRLTRFWDVQLQSLEQLVDNCSMAQRKWDSQITPEIRPDAGKVRPVVTKQLLKHHGIGGSNRHGQFAFGFPIAGRISHLFVYDEDADYRA